MSAIAKPMAHDVSATNINALIPVEQVKDVSPLDVPAIGNYGPKYYLTFTLLDGTSKQLQYTTSALRDTALSDYKAAFSTAF